MNTALQRLDYVHLSGDLIRKYFEFSSAARVDEKLANLVDIRASQLNGCAFCLDMHVKQAKLHGERELRLHHLAVWRDSPLFTPKERAALAWAEALTIMSPEGVSDEVYRGACEQFSPEELTRLAFHVVSINGWNRMNVAFRSAPGSHDKAFGLDKAGLT